MTSKSVSNGMPLRVSLGIPNSSIENSGNLRSRSCLVTLRSILYILYSLEVGSFLIFIPWFPFWENNYLLFKYPGLRPLLASPYVKGAVLGLGIVNLIIGLHEIVHFRKGQGNHFPQ
jgi:hypothetical protein